MSWSTILAGHLDRWEGLRLTAYQDRKNGVWTIGWGHTGPEVVEGLRIDRAQAEAWLASDMGWAARTADLTVKVPLDVAGKMKAAITSLIFNIGSKAWGGSTALLRLNAGDYAGAAEAMTWWNKDQNEAGELVEVPGLVNRRESERLLFLGGYRNMKGAAGSGVAPITTGTVRGGEAKPMRKSKTQWWAGLGLTGVLAKVLEAFSGIKLTAPEVITTVGPIVLLGFIFAAIMLNRLAEARRGEH